VYDGRIFSGERHALPPSRRLTRRAALLLRRGAPARRGRGTALRVVYGGALLIGLAFVYASEFSTHDLFRMSDDRHWISLKEQANFARNFALMLLLLQNVAVLALTPAYLAGAVAGETEKKTLPLLFTTALTNREIILGKMLARLAHVGGVLLVGLPVLSLAQLWGGVDLRLLLAGFASTALALLSVGAVCMLCSVMASTVLRATISAYVLTGLLACGCLCYPFSPIFFVIETARGMTDGGPSAGPGAGGPAPAFAILGTLPNYAAVHGVIAFVGVAWAMSRLRPPPEPPLGLWGRHEFPAGEEPPESLRPIDLADNPAASSASPPVGDDALFWKEVLQGAGPAAPKLWGELLLPGALVIVAVAASSMAAGSNWLNHAYGRPTADWQAVNREAGTPLVRLGTVCLLTIVCLVVGFRAAGSVVRERDRRTLDGLLVLPVTRERILGAKWLGSVLRMRHLLYYLLALWLVGVCTGALHPLALPLLVLTTAAHIACVASLGVWVSVTARNTLWANFTMAVLLLLYCSGGGLAWLLTANPVPAPYVIALNPWLGWWLLAFPALPPSWSWSTTTLLTRARFDERLLGPTALLAPLAGAFVSALLAVCFWRLAVRRFRREEGRAA
jgi:ABC-type transport system involved in multi-copper enzyme maturation permease subunit